MLVRPLGESYLICRNEDGALAGSASLGHIVFGNLRSAYLGYSAFVPHQGQGFMTEGLELVLRHAFGTLALHRVEVNVQPDNERSIALAERLGFRREGFSPRYLKIGGRWRDHVRFAMLADEFAPVRAPALARASRRSRSRPRRPPTARTPPRTGRAPGARAAARRPA